MIPDNVEKIIMTKEDYNRNVEQLLVEKLKLEQELQRKNNEIKQLQEDIVNHIKIASEYKEQMIIKDNIINGLKAYIQMNINATCNMNNDNYNEGRYNASCDILDKINELEGDNK